MPDFLIETKETGAFLNEVIENTYLAQVQEMNIIIEEYVVKMKRYDI